MFLSLFILQNFIFSLPHETKVLLSKGLNFIVFIGVGLLCLITTVISSKLLISHKIILSLFCSVPIVHNNFESLLSVISFTLSKGVVNIFIHLNESAFQTLIIEFVPS